MINPREVVSGKTILVIDDDLVSVALMKNILRKVRCRVIAARDAFEGWHIIRTEKPHAVFIDIVMPYVNGVTLFEYIRKTPETRALPCLIFTSTPTTEYASKIAMFGGGYMLVKPVTAEVVLQKLSTILMEFGVSTEDQESEETQTEPEDMNDTQKSKSAVQLAEA
jgi:CheY-like chemotaxis protein